MKKYTLTFLLTCVTTAGYMLTGCNKDSTSRSPTNNTTHRDTPKISLEDTFCRNWLVRKATHNGDADGSSVGLKVTFYKNGTYMLNSGTSYQGTWEFLENKTRVLLDKNNPSYKTTWTIVNMSSKKLDVTFKSPFTGGNAEWFMDSY